MVCPTCGADVTDGQAYCTLCGASLRGVTDATQPVTAASSTAASPTAPPTANAPAEPMLTPPAAEPLSNADLQITELTAPTRGLSTTTISSAQQGPDVTKTQEVPAVFDGHDDVVALPEVREPFRLRFIFVASFVAALAMFMAAVGDVIEIRTSRPASGIVSGISTLDDIGSNLGPAGLFGSAVMVVGGLLACFGLRWGAGLAGGAGLALAGWSALTIGLVEVPVGIAESVTRTSADAFTLTVTRDVGWWLVIAVGGIGALVFLGSLRAIGRGRHRALNPLVAAVGAVCALVLATGPLVPVGDATWNDNVRSPTAAIDLPTIFFAGRLTQVALIAVAGMVGFLLVRSYGLGLAAGAISVAGWLWLTSILELGLRPVGIADRNPGALDTVPHGVTTVGMVTVVVALILAVIFALVSELSSRNFDR